MKICLCDDDSTQLEYLKFLIEKWQRQTQVPLDFSIYQSSEELLFENEECFPFDIMILDIQMGKMNGINLARRIREYDKKVVIVFLSGISEYVFEGYEVAALRYLLKPVKEEQLFQILDTVKSTITEEKKYVIVQVNGIKKKIEHQDIIYIESFGHYVTIYTENESYEFKKGINELFEELNTNSFIITHRSFVVNLNYIDKITKTDCLLTEGTKIPISRNSYKDVNEAFIKFYQGGL